MTWNSERVVPVRAVVRIDPAEIARQRAAGWPDFHPEDFCHKCGRRFHYWFSPEFNEVRADDPLDLSIICANCFLEHAAARGDLFWTITRTNGIHDRKPRTRTEWLAHMEKCDGTCGWLAPVDPT